jgi:hypothetical protein
MRIKYIGGPANVAIADVVDARYRSWYQGEVKDVPDADIDVTEQYGWRANALGMIFGAGFAFVDEATGKNPLLACSKCGEKADHDSFNLDETIVPYEDKDGNRLCPVCFLGKFPQYIAWHKQRAMPQGLLQKIVIESEPSAPEPAAAPKAAHAPAAPAPEVFVSPVFAEAAAIEAAQKAKE